MHKSILSLFSPEGLLDYFDIIDYQTQSTIQELFSKDLIIFLEEKKIVPEEYKDLPIKTCGFMEAREVDDFPIRDMLVKLNIKCRRCDIVIDVKRQKVSRDWNLVIEGIRMSEYYSAFLKEIS